MPDAREHPGKRGTMFQVKPSQYGPIEKALAIAHEIPEAARGSFGAALSNLRKLGALGEQARVGRGAALTYTATELNRLICAVELTEAGLSPSVSVGVISAYWDKLEPIFTKAAAPLGRADVKGGDDVLLILNGLTLRTGAWSKAAGYPGVPAINWCRRHELSSKLSLSGPAARAVVINVTECLKRFHDVFAETYLAAAVEENRAAKTKGADKPGGRVMRGSRKR
jgi:hypothetical protein